MDKNFCVFKLEEPIADIDALENELAKMPFEPIPEKSYTTLKYGFIKYNDWADCLIEEIAGVNSAVYLHFVLRIEEKKIPPNVLNNEFEKMILTRFPSMSEFRMMKSKKERIELKENFERDMLYTYPCSKTDLHFYVLNNEYLLVNSSNYDKVNNYLLTLRAYCPLLKTRRIVNNKFRPLFLMQCLHGIEQFQHFDIGQKVNAFDIENKRTISLKNYYLFDKNVQNVVPMYMELKQIELFYDNSIAFNFSPDFILSNIRIVEWEEVVCGDSTSECEMERDYLLKIKHLIDDLIEEFGGEQEQLFDGLADAVVNAKWSEIEDKRWELTKSAIMETGVEQ